MDNRRALVAELRRRITNKYRRMANSPLYGDQISFGSPDRNTPAAQARAAAGGDRVDQYRRRRIQGPEERRIGPNHYRLI
jgi:hypothetical protein